MPSLTQTRATLTVRTDLIDRVHELVDSGEAASVSGLVERAIRREILRTWRNRLSSELEHAVQNPEFLRDMEDVETAFRASDSETARMLDED